MGHGTGHHREQNPGTGYYKGHSPSSEHEKCNDQDLHHHDCDHENGFHKELAPGPRQHEKQGKECCSGISDGDLVAECVAVLSEDVKSLGASMEIIIQKVASMAYHVIATEEVLAEIAASSGVDLKRVNERIRTKISDGTDNYGDANIAIDVAASIVSPRHR